MGTVAEGRDTWCVDSVQPGRYARGLELVAQRCYRRLITPPGTLLGGEDEADFGLDLSGFVGASVPRDADAMLPVMVRNELRKDPAVVDVEVDAARTDGGGQVSWTMTITVTTTDGDVSLIVGVSSVSVDLLGVR